MPEGESELIALRIQLARIEGMLTRAHGDYDRRIENLEKSQTGAGLRLSAYLAPVISAMAVVVAFWK